MSRELGTTLPEAETQQEALVLLLQKRAKLLKERLQGVEEEFQQRLAEGGEGRREGGREGGRERGGGEWILRTNLRVLPPFFLLVFMYSPGETEAEFGAACRGSAKMEAAETGASAPAGNAAKGNHHKSAMHGMSAKLRQSLNSKDIVGI